VTILFLNFHTMSNF